MGQPRKTMNMFGYLLLLAVGAFYAALRKILDQ